jgi:hypothetical protein
MRRRKRRQPAPRRRSRPEILERARDPAASRARTRQVGRLGSPRHAFDPEPAGAYHGLDHALAEVQLVQRPRDRPRLGGHLQRARYARAVPREVKHMSLGQIPADERRLVESSARVQPIEPREICGRHVVIIPAGSDHDGGGVGEGFERAIPGRRRHSLPPRTERLRQTPITDARFWPGGAGREDDQRPIICRGSQSASSGTRKSSATRTIIMST